MVGRMGDQCQREKLLKKTGQEGFSATENVRIAEKEPLVLANRLVVIIVNTFSIQVLKQKYDCKEDEKKIAGGMWKERQ